MDFPANALTSGSEISFSLDSQQFVVGGFYARTGDNVLYVVQLNA